MNNVYKQILSMRISMKVRISHAEQIVAGAPIEKKHKPITSSECTFGQLHHKVMPFLKDMQAYKRIEIHHENQHILYLRIYNLICPYDACSIRCPSDDCSTLAKLSGKAAKLREQHRNEARELIPLLRLLNEELLEMVDLLEEQVRKADKTPAELSTTNKKPRKHAETNRLLDSLDLKIDHIVD